MGEVGGCKTEWWRNIKSHKTAREREGGSAASEQKADGEMDEYGTG